MRVAGYKWLISEGTLYTNDDEQKRSSTFEAEIR